MHYKTMVLALLQEQTQIYESLRQSRTLLPALDQLARELKHYHEEGMIAMSRTHPLSSPEQISSEALEGAIQELRDSLSVKSPTEDPAFSLDAVLAFLARPTPPA